MRAQLTELESRLSDASQQTQPANTVLSSLYKEKLTELRRVSTDLERLRKQGTAPADNAVRDHLLFKSLLTERDYVANERN